MDWARGVSLTLTFTLLATPPLTAQPEGNVAAAAPEAPFLWKIESPGSKPSYLFGTIHLPRPAVAKIPDSVLPAFDSADAVYTEIPMDMGTIISMTTEMFLPEGQTLKDVLPAPLFEEVLAELDSNGLELPLTPRDRMKVWAFTVSLATLEDELRYPGVLPLDMLLFQRAAMAGKQTGGLETAAEQLGIFDEMSEADQIALLQDTLIQMKAARESGESLADQLLASYQSGDLKRLEADMEEMEKLGNTELTGRLMERLLDKRNLLMAGRITEKIKTDPETSYFFAVGAAHLYGEKGLIALLEKDGFTLTRETSLNSQPSTLN